eukprot:3311199-Prymnesium_polylepis.1
MRSHVHVTPARPTPVDDPVRSRAIPWMLPCDPVCTFTRVRLQEVRLLKADIGLQASAADNARGLQRDVGARCDAQGEAHAELKAELAATHRRLRTLEGNGAGGFASVAELEARDATISELSAPS